MPRNKIDDLRNHLFEAMEMLKDKEMDIDTAKAMRKQELEIAFKGGMALVEAHLYKPIELFDEFYEKKLNNES